jgi:hypothetical protein
MTKRFDDLDLVRQIWVICGQVPGYNTLPATNTVLENHQSSMPEAFLEFAIWNFNTGVLADTVNFYTDGRLYPEADTTLFIGNLTTQSPFSIPNTIQFPQQLATNYIVINSISNAPGGVVANFDGQNLSGGEAWRVALMGFRVGDSHWVDIGVNPSSGVGAGHWPGWNNYSSVILVPIVSGLTADYSTFSYRGTLQYEPADTGSQAASPFAIGKAYPSPFVQTGGTSLTIPYSLDKLYDFADLEMVIYDASGGLVQKIPGDVSWQTFPGTHNLLWNGKNSGGDYIASGIYIILLRAGNKTATGKIAVVNSAN